MPPSYFQMHIPTPDSWSSPLPRMIGFFPVSPTPPRQLKESHCFPFHITNQRRRSHPSSAPPLDPIFLHSNPVLLSTELLVINPHHSTSTWPPVQGSTAFHVDNSNSFLTGLARPTWLPFHSGQKSNLSKPNPYHGPPYLMTSQNSG